MAHDLIIRPEAEAELAEAFNWYEDQVSGLGPDYLHAVEASLYGIARNPESYPVVYRNVHRCLIRRFPYAIFYLVKPERIVVLSVFHVRRNPEHWKNRT